MLWHWFCNLLRAGRKNWLRENVCVAARVCLEIDDNTLVLAK
jgi:hypothetical protein